MARIKNDTNAFVFEDPIPYFDSINSSNIEIFRSLASELFPIAYNECFYRKILLEPNYYAYIVYYGDVRAGLCAFYIEQEHTYIMVLGIISNLRNHGLGTWCLRNIESHVFRISPAQKEIRIHVQINNVGAKAFYEKNGYETYEMITNYYSGITPSSAFLMKKKIH